MEVDRQPHIVIDTAGTRKMRTARGDLLSRQERPLTRLRRKLRLNDRPALLAAAQREGSLMCRSAV